MWIEENHNYYDLASTLRNYGPEMAWGIQAKSAVACAKDFHMEFYLDELELDEFAAKGYEFYIKGRGLQRVLSRVEKDIPRVLAAIRNLVLLDLKGLDNEQFFQEYLHYIKPYADLMKSYIVTQPHLVKKIEFELREKLSKFHDPKKLFSILTRLQIKFVFPEKGGFFQKSFAELLKSESAELDMSMLDVPLYKEKIFDEVEKKNVIKKNNIPADVVELGNILAGIGEIRMKMRFVWMPAIYYLELFVIELKRRHGISKKNIRKYDEDELDELIRTGKKVKESVLKKRMVGFVKILNNGRVKTLVGQEANKFIKSINKVDTGLIEIKGITASKGAAKGKIIILSYAKSHEHAGKISRMKKGDILVSEMTRPNIVVACKKAGAIITDEGGITCHAAIVAREMKKPCVIGTRIATQILNDGDLVEVDADKGVVRILKRKNTTSP